MKQQLFRYHIIILVYYSHITFCILFWFNGVWIDRISAVSYWELLRIKQFTKNSVRAVITTARQHVPLKRTAR